MRTLALLYAAMAATENGPSPGTIEDLRIVVPRMWVDGGPLETLVQSAFETTIAQLRLLGAKVVEMDLADIVPWGKIQELAGAEAAHVHRAFRTAGQRYGPEVDARLTVAEGVTAGEYLEAQAWQARLIENMAEALRSADVLATPAIAQRRKVIGDDKIGGQHYRPVLSWFSALINHSGNPAIALPLRRFESSGGPPPSLQLVAPWWQEDLLIGIGAHLEERGVVGFTPPPIFYGDAQGP
jgi:Asp-tRNA(Asn)/Glu-tRNA(Gln) amidotransferase A subunit family amidase